MKFLNIAAGLALIASSLTYASDLPQAPDAATADLLQTIEENEQQIEEYEKQIESLLA